MFENKHVLVSIKIILILRVHIEEFEIAEGVQYNIYYYLSNFQSPGNTK